MKAGKGAPALPAMVLTLLLGCEGADWPTWSSSDDGRDEKHTEPDREYLDTDSSRDAEPSDADGIDRYAEMDRHDLDAEHSADGGPPDADSGETEGDSSQCMGDADCNDDEFCVYGECLEVCGSVIKFKDRQLELAAREAIDKPSGDITATDVAQLTGLYAYNRGIKKLDGIHCIKSLITLRVDRNEITSIAPVSELHILGELQFQNNYVSDITPLKDCVQISFLNFSGNHAADIWILHRLKLLSFLAMDNNGIYDLTPLQDLIRMNFLGAEYNNISDIMALNKMVEMESLALDNNQIDDLGPVRAMTNLEKASFINNRIEDLTPLVDNEGIGPGDWVDISDNPIDCDQQASNISSLRDRGVDLVTSCE